MGQRPVVMTDAERAVAHVLDAEMAAQGVSQADMARLSGIPQPSLSKMLSGEMAIPLSRMAQICAVLGVPRWEILRRADDGQAT